MITKDKLIIIMMVFNQILPTSSVRNIWRRVMKIRILILGFKGLSLGKTEQELLRVN